MATKQNSNLLALNEQTQIPALTLSPDGVYPYNDPEDKFVVIVDGKEVAWAGTYAAAWVTYSEYLRVNKDHLTRNLDNLPEPSEYFTKGEWRNLHPFDKGRADRLRHMLMGFGFYPCRRPGKPPCSVIERGDRQAEANSRAILHTLADELESDDARALAQLAKLLLLEPCSPEAKAAYYRRAWGIPAPKKEAISPEQMLKALSEFETVVQDLKAEYLANQANQA